MMHKSDEVKSIVHKFCGDLIRVVGVSAVREVHVTPELWNALVHIMCAVDVQISATVELGDGPSLDIVGVKFKTPQVGGGDKWLFNGPLKLDLQLRECYLNEDRVKLSVKEYQLVRFFMSNVGSIKSPRDILLNVWGRGYTDYIQYVRVYVSQIRNKLGRDVIRCKAGHGYHMPRMD